jgi:ABC-type uncharacterized transport system substrate-binding protein
MRRREFITFLGGAAAAWPLAAWAQQPQRMRRIGVLDTLAADDPEASVRHGAFMQGLQELGWAIGRNLRVDTRWAAGDTGRIRSLASEMVGLGPDVIFTSGFSTIRPLLDATSTLPIVFANVVDPVGAGFVASLARPAATPPGSPAMNSASRSSGWSCSNRLRPASRAWPCCAIPQFPPSSANSRPFRAWRHLLVWK